MQPFSAAIMTNAGARLFMKSQVGEAKMKFTRIAIGNGVYSADEKKILNKQEQTELKSQKNSYPISKIEAVSDRSVKLTALITNYDPISEEAVVENGYYINEMGLFAKESEDEGSETEILYSIAIVEGETGDFMPPYDGHNPAQIIQDYYATVSDAEEVVIDLGGGAVALAEDLRKIETPDWDDSGEVEGITSFTDFLESFVKGMSIYQLFSNLKAGLKYVLHAGQLVNSGMCETPGEFALDAAYGKTLTDQITGLYSDKANITTPQFDGPVTSVKPVGLSGLSYTAAPFISVSPKNTEGRAGYGFHNSGHNGGFLYLDYDGKLKLIDSNGGTHTIKYE